MTRTLLAVCVTATVALGLGVASSAGSAQDEVVPLRVGGNIAAPKKIKDVAPVYPPEALKARVSGLVIVETIINTDGTVRSARPIRSIPQLDQAAVDAVAQWQFTPTLLNGVPVPIIMSVTVNFQLDGAGRASGPDGPGQCLMTNPGTPEQASRREAAIKFLEDVNAKQRTVFIARQAKGYAPRLEQLPGLPRLEGFDVQLVADDRAYTVSVKDTKDPCGRAFFTDNTGSIYTALPTR